MRASRKAFVPAALVAVAVLSVSLVLLPYAPAAAEEPQGKESPGELARESIEQMMRALQLLVDSIPQYELPEMLDNGDIIIRRKKPQETAPSQPPEVEEKAT